MPTLGSQEGAFENVRMNYSGDQGQTIRQLISAHVLRRVAMCVLSSPHGRRQHLAVSHEKGKVRIKNWLVESNDCLPEVSLVTTPHNLFCLYDHVTDNGSAVVHSPEASGL